MSFLLLSIHVPLTIEQRYPVLDLSQCTLIHGYFNDGTGVEDIPFAIAPDDPRFGDVIELLQAKEIDIEQLKREQLERTFEQTLEFQLNRCLLDVLEESFINQQIQKIEVMRTKENEVVRFEEVVDENGRKKSIQCSNIRFEVS